MIDIIQYFDAYVVLETKKKVSDDVKGLRGVSLNWWCWWRLSKPRVTWGAFVKAMLKRFQPEYDSNLLVLVVYEEPKLELESLMPRKSFDLQQREADQGCQIPTEIANEKEEPVRTRELRKCK